MQQPNGKTVLITGASSGIGEALVRQWARIGWKFALVARREDRLRALAAEIEGRGAEALVIPADLSLAEGLGEIVDRTIAAFGRIDVLVNNAGFGLPNAYAESDPEALRRQITVNLTVPILLTHAALPHLRASKGTIINIGSSITAMDLPVMGVYGTTKVALASWNNALRRELFRTGIDVCLVEPGPLHTGFHSSMNETGKYPEMLEPPPMFSGSAEDAARRIARLLDHPRRKIVMLRRIVWPWRLFGAFIDAFPIIGDRAVSAVLSRAAKKQADSA